VIERCKWSAYCALIIAGHFILAPPLFGADANSNNTAPTQPKPSGVLANAALAAAAAANAATAAANAANAAAKAATAALEAINGILYPSSTEPSPGTLNQPAKTSNAAVAELPPHVVETLLANPSKEIQNRSTVGTTKIVAPTEHSLVGLVGKFEVPVFADAGGEFVKNIAGSQILENESAGEVGETDLIESIQAGRRFSRESLAANERTEQAKAQTGQALALLLPSVSVRASRGQETSTPSVALGSDGRPIPSETHMRTDASLVVRQPLFDLPSYVDWRRRTVVEKARTESYRASDGDAYITAVNAYLSLVSSRLQTDMTRDFEAQLKELLTYIEKRASAGAASVSDMARVRARSQGALSSRLEQESAHAAAGIEFVRLTNLVPRMVRLPELEHVGASRLPESLDVAVTTAMLNNPEVASLAAEVKAAGIDKSAAKSRFLPRVDLEYTDNYSQHAGGDTSSAGQRDQRLMMVLNWSLFSGGSDYRYHQERSARLRELKYRLDDQRRRIVQTLSANYATLSTTRERITSGYSELKSISTAAEAMSKRMLSGNQSLLDLLDVYDRYYQARVRLVNLHILEMSTVAQVVRLTKGLPGADSSIQPEINNRKTLNITTTPLATEKPMTPDNTVTIPR
jgi:outer membrane protein, adhesin transport system